MLTQPKNPTNLQFVGSSLDNKLILIIFKKDPWKTECFPRVFFINRKMKIKMDIGNQRKTLDFS